MFIKCDLKKFPILWNWTLVSHVVMHINWIETTLKKNVPNQCIWFTNWIACHCEFGRVFEINWQQHVYASFEYLFLLSQTFLRTYLNFRVWDTATSNSMNRSTIVSIRSLQNHRNSFWRFKNYFLTIDLIFFSISPKYHLSIENNLADVVVLFIYLFFFNFKYKILIDKLLLLSNDFAV